MKQTLGGVWKLRAHDEKKFVPATVPGCVHTDLIASGRIPDPWFRDNEDAIAWVWEKDWVYERSFEFSKKHAFLPFHLLRCEGLDTLARIFINSQLVLTADNMFHAWEADVAPFLRPGKNTIRIEFTSPRKLMQEGDSKHRLPGSNCFHKDFMGKSYVRKMGCSFGWDWGLRAPTVGIWRPILIESYRARLEDFRIAQTHDEGGVTICVSGTVRGCAAAFAQIEIIHEGTVATSARVPVRRAAFSSSLEIHDPQLWWPNGMGGQPLYTITVTLLDSHNQRLDHDSRRVGLRTLILQREPDKHGESFRFLVNGKTFFVKGANWIPCDIFPSRTPDATYLHLLQSAADSHFNMIRVWGGGIYEQEIFYNLCDQLGILIWQDFMFACSTYPTYDKNFIKSCSREAESVVRRLRHHPCMGLWCGNNEIEQGFVDWRGTRWTDKQMSASDYKKLFDQLLPDTVAAHDGATPYWPGSPHSPLGDRADFNSSRCGDAHAWSVWFGGESFEFQRTWTYRFMSEFGFQSFPEPRTVRAFTQPEDRKLNSWIMDYHQRSGPGNGTIFRYLLDWFLPPKDFDSTLWLTQITQALCIQYAAEHARRIQGQMDGLLYWQINDLWPGATWSSIDVHGRWKALQFFAKRFFAPVLVSLVESRAESTVDVHLSNHLPKTFRGTVHWEITTADGKHLRGGKLPASVPSQSNKKLTTLDCADLRENSLPLPLEIRGNDAPPVAIDRDLLVWTRAETTGGECVSDNLATFAKPKYLLLRAPKIKQRLQHTGPRTSLLTLSTDVPSLWTRIELTGRDAGARLSDNFLHVHPRHPRRIEIRWQKTRPASFTTASIRATPLTSCFA